MVQVREKSLSLEELTRYAKLVRQSAGDALMVVNGCLQVAEESEADGLHLPEDAPDPDKPFTSLIGRSVHSVKSARALQTKGVDYLFGGSVFNTASHPDGSTLELEGLACIAKAMDIPIIGIGGIDSSNSGKVIKAGALGVAVIRAILCSTNPRKSAQSIRSSIERRLAL